ncbi:hypothetical protein [Cupriavidus sp. 8B]
MKNSRKAGCSYCSIVALGPLNQKMTKVRRQRQKLYLSPVMDLYAGKIIAYQTERRLVFGQVASV